MRCVVFMLLSLGCLGTAITGCSDKSAADAVWSQYETHPDMSDGYIDNDEYYVPPSGYTSDGPLDAD